MAKNVIKGMVLTDSTELDVENLSNEALKKVHLFTSTSGAEDGDPNSESGANNHLTFGTNMLPTTGTYGTKNTDIRARKSVRIWPGRDSEDTSSEASAAEIDLMGDGAYFAGVSLDNIKQIHVKAMISKEITNTKKNKTIRLKQTCSELELNNKNSTGLNNETAESAGDFSIKAKYDNDFQNLNIKGRSIDIRTQTNGIVGGSGGGLALQIASCDGTFKENKLKIETARKVSVFNGLPTSESAVKDFYNSTDGETFEGGTGIEIGTINSQFESLGTAEIRRLANSSVFAVTRGTIEQDTDKKKWDYPTQTDDSKDIKSDSQCAVKFIDIINAAIYLKAMELIPSDGSFVPAVNVSYSLTNVTSDKNATIALKSADFTRVLSPSTGTTVTATVTISGNDCTADCWNSSSNTVSIQSANLSGDVVITATAA